MKKRISWIIAAALMTGILVPMHAVAEQGSIVIEAEESDSILIKGQQDHDKNFPIEGVGVEYYGTMFAKNTLEIQTSSTSEFPAEGLIVTYSFNVTEEGDYQLTVSANQHSGLTYLSPYGIAVNGGEFVTIGTENAGAAASPNGGFNSSCPDIADNSKFPIAIYNTNLYYHLYPGENTVSFKVLSSREMDSKAFAALAYIRFDKQLEPEVQPQYTIMGTDGHSIDYADGAAVMEDTTSLPGTLNVKTAADSVFPDSGITITYTFRSEAAASYRLSLSSSVHTRTTTLSTYAVSVNGSEFVTVDSSNAGPAENPNGGWSGNITDVENMIGVYRTGLVYDLEQGTNTVSVKILTPRDSDGRAYFYLEYIRFQLLDAFDHAEFENESISLELGAETGSGVLVIGASGSEMDPADAEITVSSDSPAVTVDNNGMLKAAAPGSAVIHAVVTMEGITSEADMVVYVTVNGKYASAVSWYADGNAVSAIPAGGMIQAVSEVINSSTSPTRMSLVIMLYDEGGIKDCRVSALTLEPGERENLEITADCTGAVRAVGYVLENIDEQLPLNILTELK